MDTKKVVKSLLSLANESRLLVFKKIVENKDEGICPCNISDFLGIARNTLSFHLKNLENAGLIESSRNGKYLMYRPNMTEFEEIIEYLIKDCCAICEVKE